MSKVPTETLNASDASSGFDWWIRTLKYKTGINLTDQEKVAYEEERKIKTETEQCAKCNEYKDFMLQYSPTVTFMVDQIRRAGGYVDPAKINCEICTVPRYGGFNPGLGVQLCANYIDDRWVLNDTLSHELVHWYDNTRFKVDWGDIRHHACTEIRAASLSGECAIVTEFKRRLGFMRYAKGHQACVKRKAILSVINHPKCKDKQHAEEVVDEVFRSCFNDTRPFETIYR
ncbi:hypothetical protein KL928_001685 [Ogataea angusta]|uniref:Mitochondrial inner membrane protease ATP23 n=1 Tax=Pichia angusta TaxID=870730 RepID=A0AAN6DIN4_PICAN|nr:uncharacterized protein KL928_001685 [Ogataea angusta]KAG7820248.1 hypothetical protein KL928_001685 [Ogataea angusta]